MEISDWLWILFMLIFLQPVLQKRVRDVMRVRLIRRIEAQRGTRVILLVHRQETMSLFGIPIMRYIDVNDSEEVLRAIRETDPAQSIDFVLHTAGGIALAALQIARALKDWPGKVTVHVPHYAMSGGTLIAFAADEISMTTHAVLGPVDPQVGGYPAAAVLSVVARKPVADIDDQTLIIADVAGRAVEQMRAGIRELLANSDPERADSVARLFTEGAWTHDRPVTVKDLHELGFNVSTEVPNEILELMALYRSPVRGQRTVEYLPRED